MDSLDKSSRMSVASVIDAASTPYASAAASITVCVVASLLRSTVAVAAADFVNVVKGRLGEETIASNAPVANNSDTATAAQSSEELDDVAKAVIEAAADAYGVDASGITLATDIREDLSNESMKMIVMISTIEDQLNVTIEIQEASNLNTIGDFVAVVRERL